MNKEKIKYDLLMAKDTQELKKITTAYQMGFGKYLFYVWFIDLFASLFVMNEFKHFIDWSISDLFPALSNYDSKIIALVFMVIILIVTAGIVVYLFIPKVKYVDSLSEKIRKKKGWKKVKKERYTI